MPAELVLRTPLAPATTAATTAQLRQAPGSAGVALERAAYDTIVSSAIEPTLAHTPPLLGSLLAALLPGGKLLLTEPVASAPSKTPPVRTADELVRDLKLAGFVDTVIKTRPLTNDEATALKQFGDAAVEIAEIETHKPNFEVGASVKFTFKTTSTKSSTKDSKAVWVLTANDDGNDDGGELLDDGDILTAEDMLKPLNVTRADCGTTNAVTGKKKACRDCSCGVSEEPNVEIDLEDDTVVFKKKAPTAPVAHKSSCGSCHLADPFRCGGCPHLGMPAFTPGEPVKLDLSDDI